jgi:two-component system sensor kinase FixL
MEEVRNAHLLEAALEVAQLGSWVSDVTTAGSPGGNFAPSQRAHLIFGLTEGEFDNKASTYWKLVHPEDRPIVAAASRRAIESNEPHDVEHRIIRPDGTVRWVHERLRIQRDGSGTPLSILGVVQDTTDRRASEARVKELQAELAHATRLSEMNQMAFGLAHELIQPLAATLLYVKALQRLIERANPQSLERAKEASQRAVREVQRASEIIERLRAFVKKAAPERKAEPLLTLMEEAKTLALIGTPEYDVVVHLRAAPDLPRVIVDKIQIQQVLVNILRNAIEALASSPRRKIVVEAARGDEGYVVVSVTDTGPGLAQSVADRLFQPFVTTKPHGMGVGLSLCRAIIEAHNGRLWAEQNPEGGAIFRFAIPAMETHQAVGQMRGASAI